MYEVNELNILEEAKNLSQQLYDSIVEYSGIKAKVLQAKFNLESVYAKLYLTYRTQFDETNVKYTENKLDCIIKTTDEYMKANQEVLNLKQLEDLAFAKKEALASKKDMIKIMADLWMSNYYDELDIPKSEKIKIIKKKLGE